MERRVLDGEVTLQDRELWRLKCKDLFFQVCGRSRTFYLSSKHQQMPPGCRVFSTVYSRGVFARHIDIDMFERFACLSKKYEDWESLLHKLKAGALYLFLIGSIQAQALRLVQTNPIFVWDDSNNVSEPDVENYYSKPCKWKVAQFAPFYETGLQWLNQ